MANSYSRLEGQLKSGFSGFTLMEFMLTLLIISIFLLAVQNPIAHFHKIVVQEQWQSGRQMELDRVQMIMKGELLQAGYGVAAAQRHKTLLITADALTFQADWNQDGDFLDVREDIVYHFDAEEHILYKKSGSGGFQPLLEELYFMKFEAIPLPANAAFQPLCLVIHSQMLASQTPLLTTFCPLFL